MTWGTAQVCDYHAVLDRRMALKKRNEWIIARPLIRIEFDYPLSGKSAVFLFCRPTGFTRLDLLACIYKGYAKIYGDPSKYSVWGHSIGDLFIEGIIETMPGYYTLAMGS